MHKRLIILFLFFLSWVFAEISVIELPIRWEYEYAKRVPGKFEFFIITRLPGSGKMIAIPESELARFLQIAEDEDFDSAQIGDLDYMPAYWNAIGEVGKATITLEHTGELRFFMNGDGYWITWDDEHPAPVATLNGEAITDWYLAEVPMAPNPVDVRGN
jgi:hypothetical protein